MKYSIIAAVAALAGFAQAQDACLTAAAAIPPCALGYLASAASSIGQCGLVDFQCQCSNSAAVQSAILQTVIKQCGGDAGNVANSAMALCSCASANPGQSVSLNAVESKCEASAAAIPPCALGYLASAANSIGGCAIDDFACQCSNSASVQNAIQATVASQCGSDIGAVLNSAAALCSCAGGSGGSSGSGSAAPTGSSGPSGSSGSSGSAKPSGSAASTPAPTAGPSGGSGGTGSNSMFTGAAATVPAVGGVFGAVIALLAWL